MPDLSPATSRMAFRLGSKAKATRHTPPSAVKRSSFILAWRDPFRVSTRADNHIDGQDETLGNRPTNWIAKLWPFCACTKHDQHIHIAVRSNLSASMAAEENDFKSNLMEGFNFFNNCDQIGAGELKIGCGNAVASNVGWNVLVVRESRGECGFFGMRKVIVPIQAFCSAINFVSIRRDQTICKIQFFSHSQADSVCESRLSFGCSSKGAG